MVLQHQALLQQSDVAQRQVLTRLGRSALDGAGAARAGRGQGIAATIDPGIRKEGHVKRVGSVITSAVIAYYALMLSLYLSREVKGGPVLRVVWIAITAYYALMSIVYLNREVFREDAAAPGSRALEDASPD